MSLLVVNGADKRIHLINQAHLFDGSQRAYCGAFGPFSFAESARYACEPCPYCVEVDQAIRDAAEADRDWEGDL